MSSTKRSASSASGGDQSAGGPPTKKRPKMDFDFDVKFIATSQDDLDMTLLRVQNRRLAERLLQRQRIESELRQRIEQMEKKQLNDDTRLYVINRYWNQLNEDMRLILQRFDSTAVLANDNQNRESSNDDEDDDRDEEDSNDQTSMNRRRSGRNENAETTSFIRQLANLDKEELDEQLQQRVLLSTSAVSKVLQAFDRIVQRNEKVMAALKERTTEGDHMESENQDTPDEPDTIKSPDHEDDDDDDDVDLNDPLQRSKRKGKKYPKLNLDETVRQLNEELTKENKNLNMLVTSLHEKHHTMSLKYTQLTDKLESKDLQLDELKNRIDELEFELNKSRTREQRLEDHLYEAREKLRDFQQGSATSSNSSSADSSSKESSTGMSSQKIDDLKRELEEQRELATSRLQELEQLNNEHKETLKLVEKYRIDLQCLPDSVIKESAEFKSLQSHFSVLFNESMQLKSQLDETRQQLTSAKNVHMRQIEEMEVAELTMQKRLRNECIQLEDSLAQVRKEYEMLRLEFEQTLAANEQTGPINREMRHLITSLQNHTQQLKGENARIKKKLKESNVEIGRLKHIIAQNGLKVCCGGILLPGQKTLDNGGSISCTVDCKPDQQQQSQQQTIKTESDSDSNTKLTSTLSQDATNEQQLTIKQEPTSDAGTPPLTLSSSAAAQSSTPIKKSPSNELIIDTSGSASATNIESSGGEESATRLPAPQPQPPAATPQQPKPESPRAKNEETIIRELKSQLRKQCESNRELRVLLDVYKTIDKEKREKAHIIVNEKKLRIELEELRQQHKKLVEEKRAAAAAAGGSKSEDDFKKITEYEDIIKELQKKVTDHKQQEEALLSEMEVTGQAFEDMQEQNCRLIQQLREKDDANFKLMSERIKSNQVQKLLREEKELLTEQIVTLQHQIETQNQVVRKLEEKERMLQNSLTTKEKELNHRQQAVDYMRRKTIESSQSAADLKMHLDKYVAQIKDAQSIVADKTSAWQQEMFKTKRLHEEVNAYKRKYERAKKFELAATADEVLQEEIRELREELTCPSCKTKRKDAVLNKCFHVFCYDCLKTRYETRQRKCPKCNQSFSANDFHRLYLA